ncbi:MAG: GNAT family N-acetyltransferase [Anaerolineae bacterium]|nr:GNAT family N-acetyltransferase [Anaerolineae bacterium]
MIIRPYHSDDDPALMALERQSPRGFPKPFIHYRNRFINRAELYKERLTLVAEARGQVVGVTSIALKDTFIGGQPVKVGYSFDTRVHPQLRRNGIGHAMVEEKLRWAREAGAVGAYSLIVSTNQASQGMVAKAGYAKARIILYLEYTPYPMLEFDVPRPECLAQPRDHNLIDLTYYQCDLYVPYVAERVQNLEYQRWCLDMNGQYTGLSVYNQSQVYMQISADTPWPTTPTQVERLGRNLQVFDQVGTQHGKAFTQLFHWLRDEAVSTNVNKITWLVDRADPIPAALLQEAAFQKDYWLMFKSLIPGWQPRWSERIYLDPRDL